MQKSTKLFFAYTRVSTQRQGVEGVSLEAQRRAIQDYAQRQNLAITQWFEERQTAAKRGRPIFVQMLSLLRKGKANGLIVHKIDRSARNLKDWADLGELVDTGVDIHFANENYDLRSRGGRLSADIQAVVAADFIRNLREETKKGILARLQQGRYPRWAPVGYLNCGKGIKKPDPIRGPLVRQAFELYATGNYSLEGLIEEMDRRGLRNCRGTKLSRNGMSCILNNRFYMGLIPMKGMNLVFAGVHEPLVSKILFDRVQQILRGKTMIHAKHHFFVFSRLITCKVCSRHLSGEIQKGHTYYGCRMPSCPQRKSFREEMIEKTVLAKFRTIRFSETEEAFFRTRFEEFLHNLGSAQDQNLKSLKLQFDQITAKISRLVDAYAEGILVAEIVREKQNALLAEKKDIENRLASVERQDMIAVTGRMRQFFELARNAEQSYKIALPEEKRDLVRTLTSNLAVEAENLFVELTFPFSELEKCSENNSSTAMGIRTPVTAVRGRCPRPG